MLVVDRELTEKDIQGLSSPDAVAALFAALGYSTNVRTSQSPANLGISNETLTRQIRRLELLADQDGLLQVYLVELSSVTVAATRNLTSAFRALNVQFPLLVLTSDYEHLDFLFLEKVAPMAGDGSGPMTRRQITVRPRSLSVERRNPSRVALRVLRRFTYTESDPLGQAEKLLSAYAVADWSEEFFNNRALFSDYYLLERLREHPAWHEDPKPTYRTLRDLYASARSRWTGRPEAEVRSGLILPVLKALGHDVRPGPDRGGDRPQPHFKLFASSRAPSPSGVCLAYRWDRSLDGRERDEGRPEGSASENPGQVVVSLLENREAGWAIVTNGKHWRLYSAKAHSRATNYYEIDLEEVLAADNKDPQDSFRYFWLLFRREAFEGLAAPFLDAILQGSQEYAKRLGERLKERVFEEIFPHLAEGFIEYRRQQPSLVEGSQRSLLDVDSQLGLRPVTDEGYLQQVFQGTLTFLYRLLFLLYAESRDLLPVREFHGYYQKSLARLKREVAQVAGDIGDEADECLRGTYRKDATAVYDRLLELFHLIDQGDPGTNLPAYNGGLFISKPEPDDTSPEAAVARFLLSHKVPDLYLARALDLLARDEDDKTFKRAFIDYKSLGVRQLGSIYEGLLEFKLRIAKERMAICRGKKTDEVIPYEEAVRSKRAILKQGKGQKASEKTLPKGAIYLENGRRERKATGSYYTPDFIVKYIVERTLGPVLKEKFAAVVPKIRDAQGSYRRQQENARIVGAFLDANELHKKAGGPVVVDELFDVKSLDPAMGSGHFLVEAVDFVTDRMLDFLSGFPWNPVAAMLEETRRSILTSIEDLGIAIDAARLTDVNLLRRHVLKRCIYGVDVNPMAVELAKVSLWLDSFTLGAPLSFLDHHLRCGNSLVGSRSVREHILPTAARYADFQRAVANLLTVNNLADATASEVRRSRSLFTEAWSWLEPFRQRLNVELAQSSLKLPVHALAHAMDAAFQRGRQVTEDAPEVSRTAIENLARAQDIARENRYFHWELEFPDVFFGPGGSGSRPVTGGGQGGFDAVIGNPPWVRQEALAGHKTTYQALFPEVYHGTADIYVFFLGRASQVARAGGSTGFIVPNKWLRAAYGERLRKHLTESMVPRELVDFGHAPIFPDADTFPCILLCEKPRARPNGKGSPLRMTSVPRGALDALDLARHVRTGGFPVPIVNLRTDGWTLEPPDIQRLIQKIRSTGARLKEYVGQSPLYGVKTGLNEAFLVDQDTRDRLVQEDPKCEQIVKPFLRGSDVRRWLPEWGGEWMIVLRSSENHPWPWADSGSKADPTFKRAFPSLWQHFKHLEHALQKRQDQGRYWWELRSCDYYEAFDNPKILWQEIAFHSQFAFDDASHFVNNMVFSVPTSDLSLLALLNSQLLWWYMARVFPHKKDEAIALHGYYVEQLPVPPLGEVLKERMTKTVQGLIETRKKYDHVRAGLAKSARVQAGVEPELESLDHVWKLDFNTFEKLIREASARGVPGPLPARLLKDFTEAQRDACETARMSLQLEAELQELVYRAYSLTDQEVALVKATAPPRDPMAVAEETFRTGPVKAAG